MTNTITIKRPVLLKVIVTEEFKKGMLSELQEAVNKVESGIQQMEFQTRRYLSDLQRTDLNQAARFRQQVESEKNKQEAMRRDLQQKIKDIENLSLGEEFLQGTIESLAEIQKGDDLHKVLSQTEVVIKDGIILEIRES